MKRILPVYPWPMHPKVAEELDKIPDIQPVGAVPGGPTPVLAIRNPPPFAADAIVVMSPDRVPEGVRIALGDGIKLVTVRDVIESVFGSPVTEYELVKPESKSKVRFA